MSGATTYTQLDTSCLFFNIPIDLYCRSGARWNNRHAWNRKLLLPPFVVPTDLRASYFIYIYVFSQLRFVIFTKSPVDRVTPPAVFFFCLTELGWTATSWRLNEPYVYHLMKNSQNRNEEMIRSVSHIKPIDITSTVHIKWPPLLNVGLVLAILLTRSKSTVLLARRV